MNNKIFLVLGGARSGKSEFAEKLMYHSTGKRKGYIATSQILDDEMKYPSSKIWLVAIYPFLFPVE